MMRKLLTLLLFAIPFGSMAQCRDTTAANPFHYCGQPFQPVCGCDNVTYRNPCVAEYRGGIINATQGLNYVPGVCGTFDIDFVPNPVGSFATGNSDSHLHIYINEILFTQLSSVGYSVYILDLFNKVMFQRDAVASTNDNIAQGSSINYGIPVGDLSSDFFSRLENGVYLLIVVVNGEQKTQKIVVENPQ
jgi:hypothetical protein